MRLRSTERKRRELAQRHGFDLMVKSPVRAHRRYLICALGASSRNEGDRPKPSLPRLRCLEKPFLEDPRDAESPLINTVM